MTTKERYKMWCQKMTDAELSRQLVSMKNNPKAIENAFFKDLTFGTGGLRGEIGVGTNCLNIYTIAKITQGIADNMKANGLKTAVVTMDSRINSDIFAVHTALVFAQNGIKTYLTRELMPTPFLSYMTRALNADIGIVITASHNPAKYNGYKVYGADGGQITDARAADFAAYIDRIDPFDVHTGTMREYLESGLIEYVPDEIEKNYLAETLKQSCGTAEGLKVAYTPLNGAGYRLVSEILRQVGVTDLYIVPEQAMPDGRFISCSYPNPEKAEALTLGLALLAEKDADILIATDPDADRMGLAVKTKDGYRLMTGNETGVLLTDYLFARRKENGTLPEKPVLIKTIVSTNLAVQVAREYDAEIYDVLTGFKYIGEVVNRLEAQGEENRFVFGFEESYGCLAGTRVRDKDAVVASMLAAEMAAYYKRQGKTLAERMDEIYEKFGTYQHKLKSFEFSGAVGFNIMKRLLVDLRANLPVAIGWVKVTKIMDYLTQKEFDLPASDVLSFNFEDGSQLIVRPSGTEPLIKTYLTATKNPDENAKVFKRFEKYLDDIFAKS